MAAAIELQKAVFAALASDVALVAALGGEPRIHDHAPASVPFPYLTFGRVSVHDWSTATEEGSEHVFTIHVWSRAKGKSEAVAIMEVVHRRLHDADLDLDGHALVNLRAETQDIRFDDDHGVYHGAVLFRAVTEPVA